MASWKFSLFERELREKLGWDGKIEEREREREREKGQNFWERERKEDKLVRKKDKKVMKNKESEKECEKKPT